MRHSVLPARVACGAIALALASVAISGYPTLKRQHSTDLLASLVWEDSRALADTSGGRIRGGSFDGEPEPATARNSRSSDRQETGEPLNFFSFIIVLIILGMMYRSGKLAEIMQTSGLSGKGETVPVKSNLQTFSSGAGQTTTTYNLQSKQPAPRQQEYSQPQPRTAFRRFSGELNNNIVAITQVQVAMLAQARHVQRALAQLATETDVSNKKGLAKSLRETVVALLRSPDTWTHVTAQSKKLRSRKAAKESFEALSLEERSKFAVESLSNIEGQVRQQLGVASSSDPADYIVVTLLVGSAHDNPLFGKLHTPGDLRGALKALGSMPPEYLMVFEVLWSPQDENDSLTDDELLLHYPQIVELV